MGTSFVCIVEVVSAARSLPSIKLSHSRSIKRNRLSKMPPFSIFSVKTIRKDHPCFMSSIECGNLPPLPLSLSFGGSLWLAGCLEKCKKRVNFDEERCRFECTSSVFWRLYPGSHWWPFIFLSFSSLGPFLATHNIWMLHGSDFTGRTTHSLTHSLTYTTRNLNRPCR